MKTIEMDPRWDGLVQRSWLQPLEEVPFLVRCRRGIAPREDLMLFAAQQYHYARHFTRYLSALMGNLEREEDRRSLASNLFEEMGLGGPAKVPHSQLYLEMIASMGLSNALGTPLDETSELVQTMFECCRTRAAMVGLGALCLGAEAIVPYLYSLIVTGFEAVHEPRQRLEFFRLHIEEDDAHAETMRRIILEGLRRRPSARVELEYGATRAIQARAAFFGAIGSGRSAERKAS